MHPLLQREGRAINHKRAYRLYCLKGKSEIFSRKMVQKRGHLH
ncbi:MAG: hypothetical protein ACLP2P_11130 [Desulfobaccales bacterium]